MRTRIDEIPDGFQFEIRLDSEDDLVATGQQGVPIKLITDTTTVRFTPGIRAVHPDLVAMSALLVVLPWARERLTFPRRISSSFAETVSRVTSLDVGPVDDDLEPRNVGSRIGLMYSGGPDCMAAETLLDDQLPFFHLRRVSHPLIPNRARHRTTGVTEALVEKAQANGEEVHVARSDHEFLCQPFPSYPQWSSLAMGAVLQADDQSLGGLVVGRNISGMYLGWGRKFDPAGDNESSWEALFAAVGLPLIQPLAGTSDMVSKRIARDHRLYGLARSCIRGDMNGPCLQCKKCLLRELINATIEQRPISPSVDRSLASEPTVVSFLKGGPPYPDQHLLEYSLARLPGVEQSLLADAARRLAPDLEATAWVGKYYEPALQAHVPEPQRERVARSLTDLVEFMAPADQENLANWSADPS